MAWNEAGAGPFDRVTAIVALGAMLDLSNERKL